VSSSAPTNFAYREPASFAAGLYVVATPIGNLADITVRALQVLARADVIACEDTRTSRTLLTHYGISREGQTLWAVHEHNEATQAVAIAQRIRDSAVVALISDAGTPGISDPGARLVQHMRSEALPVYGIPGPSAVVTAMSVAGLVQPQFTFEGFLPSAKGERQRALEALVTATYPVAFYESPHRIRETLAAACEVLGGDSRVFIARELTKRFESTDWISIADAMARIDADANHARGEFVLIFPAREQHADKADIATGLPTLKLLLAELPTAKAAKLAAKITGCDKDALYAAAVDLKKE
jgi:16S rRNA (cytidine1402-2'-O)-methyltransferase